MANTSVFHSVVIQPASKTLWHSTVRQPQAPFGEMTPFTLGKKDARPPLPADPRLNTPTMEHEKAVIAESRQAMRLFDEGVVDKALVIWDGFAEREEKLLEPHRLAWARARGKWTMGDLGEASVLLVGLDADEVPFDVRINAVVAQAVIADRLGKRDHARDLYARGQALFDDHPEYNDGLVAPLRQRINAGLRAPVTAGPFPETPGLQRLPG